MKPFRKWKNRILMIIFIGMILLLITITWLRYRPVKQSVDELSINQIIELVDFYQLEVDRDLTAMTNREREDFVLTPTAETEDMTQVIYFFSAEVRHSGCYTERFYKLWKTYNSRISPYKDQLPVSIRSNLLQSYTGAAVVEYPHVAYYFYQYMPNEWREISSWKSSGGLNLLEYIRYISFFRVDNDDISIYENLWDLSFLEVDADRTDSVIEAVFYLSSQNLNGIKASNPEIYSFMTDTLKMKDDTIEEMLEEANQIVTQFNDTTEITVEWVVYNERLAYEFLRSLPGEFFRIVNEYVAANEDERNFVDNIL